MMMKIANYKNGNSISWMEYGEPCGYPILIQHGMIASIQDADLFQPLIEVDARLICCATWLW